MQKIPSDYLFFLTDDFSIWQHSKGLQIDIKHGYALDDAARALVLANKLNLFELSDIYVSFLDHAVSSKQVVNFFDQRRRPLSLPWSEDALGQCYWAYSTQYHRTGKKKQNVVFIENKVTDFKFTRGWAYALLGYELNPQIALQLSHLLINEYRANARPNWHWLEPYLTYANAIIPYSLIKFGAKNDSLSLETGLEMLDFLNRVTKIKKKPIAIGNSEWFYKGKEKSIYAQQPVDIAYQVIANVEAYQATDQKSYLQEAQEYFNWFWGNNLLNKPMIDAKNGRCLDGLLKNNLSKNCGAESIVCFLLAQAEIEPYLFNQKKTAGNHPEI